MSAYVKTVIAVILLKPFVNGIMYGEKSKKYINFVLGLLVISSLVVPISKSSEYVKRDYSHNFDEMNYRQIHNDAVKEETDRRLNSLFGVDDVDTKLDENYNIIDIKSSKKDEIKEYLGI